MQKVIYRFPQLFQHNRKCLNVDVLRERQQIGVEVIKEVACDLCVGRYRGAGGDGEVV